MTLMPLLVMFVCSFACMAQFDSTHIDTPPSVSFISNSFADMSDIRTPLFDKYRTVMKEYISPVIDLTNALHGTVFSNEPIGTIESLGSKFFRSDFTYYALVTKGESLSWKEVTIALTLKYSQEETPWDGDILKVSLIAEDSSKRDTTLLFIGNNSSYTPKLCFQAMEIKESREQDFPDSKDSLRSELQIDSIVTTELTLPVSSGFTKMIREEVYCRWSQGKVSTIEYKVITGEDSTMVHSIGGVGSSGGAFTAPIPKDPVIIDSNGDRLIDVLFMDTFLFIQRQDGSFEKQHLQIIEYNGC